MKGYGQTLISKIQGASANPDALLEVRTQFSNPRGFLMPATTLGQITGNLFPRIDNAINANDNNGLLIYADDQFKFMYFRDDYNGFSVLNPWTLSKDGSVLSHSSPGLSGFGLGVSTPQSFLDVAGGMTIGSGYAGSSPAPANGLLIQGKTVIGTDAIDSNPDLMLQVEGDVSIPGDKSYNYSTPKTKKLTIPFSSFVGSSSNELKWEYKDQLFLSTANATGTATASIVLPENAVITRLLVAAYDDTSLGSISCKFKAQPVLEVGKPFDPTVSVEIDIGTTLEDPPQSYLIVSNLSQVIDYDSAPLPTFFARGYLYYCECEFDTGPSTVSGTGLPNLGLGALTIDYLIYEAN